MFRVTMKSLSFAYLPMIALAVALSAGGVCAADGFQKRATPSPNGQRAELIINTPLDGIVYIDGRRTYNSGMTRRFVTPPLAPGQQYFYEVKVTWIEGSRARESNRRVAFKAGDRIVLNYSQPNWRETAQDLYLDPAAPAPWANYYYNDMLNSPYYPNSMFVYPGIRFYPR